MLLDKSFAMAAKALQQRLRAIRTNCIVNAHPTVKVSARDKVKTGKDDLLLQSMCLVCWRYSSSARES